MWFQYVFAFIFVLSPFKPEIPLYDDDDDLILRLTSLNP